MKLTEHFTYEELVASDLATRHGIANIPGVAAMDNLASTAQGLERVRESCNARSTSAADSAVTL